MKVRWLVLLLILCLGGAVNQALAQSDPAATKQELDDAKTAHTHAVDGATATLVSALDAEIKLLNAGGDADSAKVISDQKVAFIASGTVPQSPLMKDAVMQFQQAMRDANANLVDAYDKAIEEFGAESNFDLAMQARRERSDLLNPAAGASVTGTADESGSVLTPAAIAKELEAAKTQHRQDIDDAKKELLNTIDARISAATDAGNLDLVLALQKVQAAAAVDGSVPDDVKDDGIVAAKRHYGASLATAQSRLTLAYQKAVRDYTRARQLALAQSTRNELNSLGLTDPTAPRAMTAGTYQLASNLPDFLTAQDSVFVQLGDRLGIVVPEIAYIRTTEGDLLNKNFTFDVWFYMLQGLTHFDKLPAALVGFGDGSTNIVNGGPLDSLYLEINPPDRNGGAVNLHNRQLSTSVTIGHLKEFDTYIARIQKSGNSITFSVGTEQSGTLVSEVTTTIGDVRGDCPYLNDQNGHLFFGSGAFKQLAIGKGPAPVAAEAEVAPVADAAPTGEPAPMVSSTASDSNGRSGHKRVVNLIPLIDVNRDSISGKWKLDGRAIVSDDSHYARLGIPYTLPEEYDVHLELTRLSGNEDITQMFTYFGHSCMWSMGAWDNAVCGFTLINGLDPKEPGNPSGYRGSGIIQIGRKYSSLLQVRRGSVVASIDGKVISRCSLDPSSYSAWGGWSIGAYGIGLGTDLSPTAYSVIELTDVNAADSATSAAGDASVATSNRPGTVLDLKFSPENVDANDSGLLYDLSKPHHAAEMQNVRIVSDGSAGRAGKFDGISSSVSLGTDQVFQMSNQITIAARIRPSGNAKEAEHIVAKEDWQNNGANGYVLRLIDGKPNFTIGSSGWKGVGPDVVLDRNKWHIIAATYDGKMAKLFVDGQIAALTTMTGAIAPSQLPLVIGNSPFDDKRRFEGEISEVWLANQAWSDETVSNLGTISTASVSATPAVSTVSHSVRCVSAKWGAGNQMTDIAPIISERYDANPTISISGLPDPAPGVPKKLMAQFKIGGQAVTLSGTEGNTISIAPSRSLAANDSIPINNHVKLVSASYGADRHLIDVRSSVATKLKSAKLAPTDWAALGISDPDAGVTKTLTIQLDIDGSAFELSVQEGGEITLQ